MHHPVPHAAPHPALRRRALLAACASLSLPALAQTGVLNRAQQLLPPPGAPLKPNQRVQGTMDVQAGGGLVSMRSLATTVDADIGRKTAEKLNSAQGERELAAAQARLGTGAASRVSKADVQATADSLAGRTLYESQAQHVTLAKLTIVNLSATAADGSRVQLNLQLNPDTDALTGASLRYQPAGARAGDEFISAKKGPGAAVVKIEKIERLPQQGGLALSGSFHAGPLAPGVLAKQLKGQTLAQLSGRFNFTEVPLR
jgi:hypothetical protein